MASKIVLKYLTLWCRGTCLKPNGPSVSQGIPPTSYNPLWQRKPTASTLGQKQQVHTFHTISVGCILILPSNPHKC